ncbi:MAG: hypothetical protein JWL84_526 [Rhodospirillales bacterium]|nr:hypothetical protein [Rhodospirillales bacterium]
MTRASDIPELLNKRAHLAAEIQIVDRRLRSLRANLATLDAAIIAFAAGRAGVLATRSQDLSRTILDVLREASMSLSAEEIAERVAVNRGQLVDTKLVRDVRATLLRRRDGLLATDDRDGTTVWRIA